MFSVLTASAQTLVVATAVELEFKTRRKPLFVRTGVYKANLGYFAPAVMRKHGYLDILLTFAKANLAFGVLNVIATQQ